MPTKIVKWVSILTLSALLPLAVVWRFSTDYRTVLAALVLWAVAIVVMRPKPRLSLASITDQTPRSGSL